MEHSHLRTKMSMRDPVFDKARSFIQRNLTDSSLTSRRIAYGIGVSRAALYRSFARQGGVKRFVDDARLDLATQILAARIEERDIVNVTALLCGYESAARFSRLFRAKYHETPTVFVKRLRHNTMSPPIVINVDGGEG